MKQCFPAKRRLLCFLPGVALAGIGLSIFGFLETDENYALTHSAWHVCVAVSIIFFLPKKTIKVSGEYLFCIPTLSASFHFSFSEEPISDAFELGGSDQPLLIQNINSSDPDDLIL